MIQTDTDRLAGTRGRKGDEDAESYARHVNHVAQRRQRIADATRRLLELVEDKGVTMPTIVVLSGFGSVKAEWDCSDRDSFRAVVKALGSTVERPWSKRTNNGNYRLERTHGADLDLEVRATWGTCEQVKVGTEVKTTTEVVQPATTREVVTEVDVYEWRCPDSVLLSELDAATAPTDGPELNGSTPELT